MTFLTHSPLPLRNPYELISAALNMKREADAAGIKVALIGGLALHLMGSTRLTSDVDFVADLPAPESYERERKLTFGGEALVGPGGVPTDWVLRDDEYSELYQEALERARPLPSGQRGESLPVAPAEYIAAMKMAAGRTRDEADLEWLVTQPWFDRKQFRRVVKKHLGNYAVGELAELFQVADWKKREGRL